MKQKFLMGSVVAIAMFFVAASANAEAVCANATVVRAAVQQTAPSSAASQYMLRITCPGSVLGTSERNYYLASELGDAGFATALTVMSLKGTVFMKMEDWGWNSLITDIQLNPAP